ncbi:hypothetical protein [Coleofasciculus sp. E1-EBD-02]|uniref:hypothetical protein n=1 Tax=Coleofasciculus sp. E1-EBD-02 TaxID=3068481 RepID=UPI0032FFE032
MKSPIGNQDASFIDSISQPSGGYARENVNLLTIRPETVGAHRRAPDSILGALVRSSFVVRSRGFSL